MLSIKKIYSDKKLLISLGFIVLALIAGISHLSQYIKSDLNVTLCLLTLPFVMKLRRPGQLSYRYAILFIVACFAFYHLQMQIMLLLAFGSCVLFIIESRLGRLSVLPLFLLALLSPVPRYLVQAFSVPLRLELSEHCSRVLQMIGYEVSVSGNMFIYQGHEFSVDPACVGLNMIITSLICTILFIGIKELKTGRHLSLITTSGLMVTTILLVVVCNFFRIICLVLFHSMPETLSHELIGIFSLIMYVCVPIFFIVELAYKLKSKPAHPTGTPSSTHKLPYPLIIGMILTVSVFNYQQEDFKEVVTDPSLTTLELSGFEKEIVINGVARYQQEDLLVYIKPPARLWGADHSPLICWRGSGYKFKKVSIQQVGTEKIYMAELHKDENKLYTAWWYDNGPDKTHSQINWRKESLKGASPYRLMNLSSSDRDKLVAHCEDFLDKDLFSEPTLSLVSP